MGFYLLDRMTSTVHHQSSIPSRNLIICETDDETEPKTILEIGGVARPNPTYATPPRASIQTIVTSENKNQSHLNANWIGERTDIVPPPFTAYSDFQEQKIIRVANSNWHAGREKSPSTPTPSSPPQLPLLKTSTEPGELHNRILFVTWLIIACLAKKRRKLFLFIRG